jgi:N-acetylmuramoyl-L-alanine amidase/AmpD protein
MKKIKLIFWFFLLAVILPLAFLTVKFFLNQNKPSFTKISWEKPEEPLENAILAPLVVPEPVADNSPKEIEKPSAQITEKILPPTLDIKDRLVGWGFAKADKRVIDTIIIHSSYDALLGNPYDLEGLIKEYRQYGVAPHYLIDRKGVVYRLVEDKNVAYHAGVSKTADGRKNVNDFSLGIEIMNTQTDSPTQEQYTALKKLVDFLQESYKIKYVLGHNQISPSRKDDPWNFDWGKIKE